MTSSSNSSTLPPAAHGAPIVGVRHPTCDLQVGNFLAMGMPLAKFLHAANTKSFVPEVLVVAPLEVADTARGVSLTIAIATVLRVARHGPNAGETIVTMIINQSTKSFRASLFWVERRTRPTRASLQYALQPHDQWAQISTSPEYTVEGVRNFAACGVSLSEYFAKFKALRFASWVIAGTSFDVLNAEKQSTQVAVDSLIHLGRYEDDNALTYVAIKGLAGQFATDAAALQMYTRPTDEILAILRAGEPPGIKSAPENPPQRNQDPNPRASASNTGQDSTPKNDHPTYLVMTSALRCRDMMGRPAELAQNSIVEFLSSSQLPGWCVLTRDHIVLVPLREETVRQVTRSQQDAASFYPSTTTNNLASDIQTSQKFSALSDLSLCDSHGDAIHIPKHEVVTLFCRNPASFNWFRTSDGRVFVVDVRSPVEFLPIHKGQIMPAPANSSHAAPDPRSSLPLRAGKRPFPAIGSPAAALGAAAEQSALQSSEDGDVIDLTRNEEGSQASLPHTVSMLSSDEAADERPLRELFVPRSPPRFITQQEVQVSSWQHAHNRARDTSNAYTASARTSRRGNGNEGKPNNAW